MRRTVLFLVSLAILLLPLGALAEGGFSDDPDRIEAAAKSVLMLDVYDDDGEYVASGSGFVAFDNKTLVTNDHVIEDADYIVAYSDDGYRYIVDTVLIADERRDVAILGFFSPTDLAPLPLNADGALKRAQTVVAIGSPIGITNTVSIGNISAIYDEDGVSEVQFTAPISPGSSGGALFDDSGEVIGITSATYLDAQNINIAVHASEVVDLYAQWDGSYLSFSGESQSAPTPASTVAPTPRPTATPAPAQKNVRNVKIVADELVWCQAGKNISNGSAEQHAFDEIPMGDIWSARDYYASLTFEMDAGDSIGTAVSFEMRLSLGAELVGSITITKSFGMNETKGVQRYFEITELMEMISAPGAYAVSYFVGGVELGASALTVLADGTTSPPVTLAPTPRSTIRPTMKPTSTPQTYGKLKYGDRGDDVKKMQLALIRFGYLDDEADGIFGKKTLKAVYDFNLANKIFGDMEVASNKTLQLLYDGNPIAFSDPDMALYFKKESYAEWYNLSGDKIQIHFQVTNKAKYKVVKAFELYAYAINVWGNRIYGSSTVYYWTTTKTVKPGATIYSDYVTMPNRSDISTIYCGISRVVYTDGTVEVVDDDDIEYSSWSIDD